MPHIHDKPGQVDCTVTILLFKKQEDGLETMLHMHKKLGILLPIGGHVELDETPWQAVALELEEESGYESALLQLLQPAVRLRRIGGNAVVHPQPVAVNTHALPNEHFHSDLAYAFVVNGAPTKPLADNESDDIRWLTKDQVDNLGSNEIRENTKELLDFVMTNFEHWELVDPMQYSLNMPEKMP